MITFILIIVVVAAALFFVMNTISTKHLGEVKALEEKKYSLTNKYDHMVNQRRTLRKELEKKEDELSRIRNDQEGIKTYSAKELDIDEEDDDIKISRYLIQEGKISLEQNEKVLKKMALLKMDYIASSLALGYINLETAKKAMKVNKISSKKLNLGS